MGKARAALWRMGIVLFLVVNMTGCITFNQALRKMGLGGTSYSADTAESLVAKGLEEYNHGKYEAAKKIFDDLKSRYPFSEYSLLAELKMADSEYHLGHFKDAALLYEEFETNHPTNEAIPYVMFQVGMCHYREIDSIDRDSSGAYKAIEAFNRLLGSYPASPYTEEAKDRIRSARDFLAGHEFYVAQYYLRRGSVNEAEGRLEYIVDNFSDTAVSKPAEEILAAIQAGNPPKRTWRSWMPEFSIPDWKSFSSSLTYGPGSTSN